MCVCVSVCRYVHMSAGVHRDQERALDPLKLELQVSYDHLTWVLGTELGSSERTSALGHLSTPI